MCIATTLIDNLKEGLSNLCNKLTSEHRQQVSTFTEQCETILQAVAREKQEDLDKKEELERKITMQSKDLEWYHGLLRVAVKEPPAKRPRMDSGTL